MNKWIQYLLIRNSGLFDIHYYLKVNKDVRRADIDPLLHFIENGWREWRNPSRSFDTRYYLTHYIDVQGANINPLIHYIRHGRLEGRKPQEIQQIFKPLPLKKSGVISRGKKIFAIQNLKKSINYINRYGFKNFYKKSVIVLFPETQYRALKNKNTEIKIFSYQHLNNFEKVEKLLMPHNEGISIIIPTKNAGEEFEFLLKMLSNQKGFASLEIVIVDSGSTDKTVELAKDFRAKVIEIPSEMFSHSYSRTLGAESASNNLLFFTVQDAIPPDNHWLFELVTVLKSNDVSVVSCAETPREDADLFYRVICWNHYNFLDVNKRDRILAHPELSDHVSIRQNAQVSDIACLIPKKIYLQYKSNLNYAEDLDLGINLIKNGHKIAFLGSTRIIHSHNRPAYYFLKRGYVDNLFLSDMFNDFVVPPVDLFELIPEVKESYLRIKIFIENELAVLHLPLNFAEFEKLILNLLINGNPREENIFTENNSFVYADSELQGFLIDLFLMNPAKNDPLRKSKILFPSLQGFTNVMIDYIKNSYEYIDGDLLEEIKYCLLKQFAIVVGSNFAYSYRNRGANDLTQLEILDQKLRAGI